MENVGDKEAIAVFRTCGGIEAQRSVLRLALIVPKRDSEIVFQRSEVRTEFRVLVGECTADSEQSGCLSGCVFHLCFHE